MNATWHSVRCPPITLTSEHRCPVWRLLICIKTPSGVVRKIHWAWSDGSSDLLREKRVRPRQSLFIVICDLTPFTDLPPLVHPRSVRSHTPSPLFRRSFRTTINQTDKVFAPKLCICEVFLSPPPSIHRPCRCLKNYACYGNCNC